jgi:hypothetical protein
MTVPIERTNSVIHTREFLYSLLDAKVTPRVPKEIREQAHRLLRHYPTKFDMDLISDREDGKNNVSKIPKVFGKSFF